jgi:hypothetical protein
MKVKNLKIKTNNIYLEYFAVSLAGLNDTEWNHFESQYIATWMRQI